MAQVTRPIVQCSTGSLAPLAGGRYWNVRAMMEGIRKLGWPAVELRLWQEWDEGDMAQVAKRVRDTGVDVGSVHLPPDSEVLLSTPDLGTAASEFMEKCLAAALAVRAEVAVVHAWDLRRPAFSKTTLVERLNVFGRTFDAEGVSLSVENIPGQLRMLPLVTESCPKITFTADTRWAHAESSWDLLLGMVPRLANIHVQTYVDRLEGGGVVLGRTGSGSDACDVKSVLRRFRSRGYRGMVTLEPNGVPGVTEKELRTALCMLSDWMGSD